MRKLDFNIQRSGDGDQEPMATQTEFEASSFREFSVGQIISGRQWATTKYAADLPSPNFLQP